MGFRGIVGDFRGNVSDFRGIVAIIRGISHFHRRMDKQKAARGLPFPVYPLKTAPAFSSSLARTLL